jgi:hypothetical protein
LEQGLPPLFQLISLYHPIHINDYTWMRPLVKDSLTIISWKSTRRISSENSRSASPENLLRRTMPFRLWSLFQERWFALRVVSKPSEFLGSRVCKKKAYKDRFAWQIHAFIRHKFIQRYFYVLCT